ncbi:MAG TPA: MFS transporter [Candidatus Nanopelagicales bacterium]|nr:MFS transporter [Candidatus Nanopelagicales bacterium]
MALPATFQALGSSRGLRRVLAGFVAFTLVQWSAWMAVILYAFDEGGPGLAAIASVVLLLPAALFSPMIGGIGDRMRRGRALVLAYSAVTIGAALTLAALLRHAPVWVVLLAGAVFMLTVSGVRPVHFSVLPNLSGGPEELVSANAMSAASDEFAEFLGPVLAGLLFALVGAWFVLAVGTGLALLAVLLCLRLDAGSPSSEDEAEGWRAALEGLVALRGDGPALALLVVLTIDFILAGTLGVIGVSFAEDVLGQGSTGAGLVIGSMGIGGVVGAVVAGGLSRRPAVAALVVGGAVLSGVAYAVVAGLTALLPVMLVLAIVGAGGAITLVSGRTLLQRTTDDRILTRVFAVQESTAFLATAFGAALAPLLLRRFDVAQAFVPMGVGAAVLGLACLLLIRHLDERAVLHPAEVALLRRVSFLDVLPPYDLERLAARATWRHVDPGTVIVRQGDPGYEFFMVGDGELAVTIDGLERPHLEAGSGFGEIALLHSVPRTATVTALTEATLLVVRSEDFLAAVTGSEDGQALARDVAAAQLERDRG